MYNRVLRRQPPRRTHVISTDHIVPQRFVTISLQREHHQAHKYTQKLHFYFYSTHDSVSENMPSFLSSRRYRFFNSSMSRIYSVYCVPFLTRHASNTMHSRKRSIAIDWTEPIAHRKARPSPRDHADASRVTCVFFFTFKFVAVRYICHSMFLSLRIICETASLGVPFPSRDSRV